MPNGERTGPKTSVLTPWMRSAFPQKATVRYIFCTGPAAGAESSAPEASAKGPFPPAACLPLFSGGTHAFRNLSHGFPILLQAVPVVNGQSACHSATKAATAGSALFPGANQLKPNKIRQILPGTKCFVPG